ncbi:hypothetical protein BV372_34420 [Nostoc sp. T09]|uniref:DUF4327 family protein n=1 Tax=Nostoc sp. T09 TaxID=1932621 RepID=UPI000A3A2C35|nr:DUF4327 family protein [Nostoc sp. T09]OUL17886.1 hypothetical protein BV372_34420 [Nostoc sp. T09]
MNQPQHYDLKFIQDKARYLIEEGFIGRYQPIYALALYVNFCEWALLESNLKQRNLHIGDRIANFIGDECSDNQT